MRQGARDVCVILVYKGHLPMLPSNRQGAPGVVTSQTCVGGACDVTPSRYNVT